MERTPLEKIDFLKRFLITNFEEDGCVDLSNLDLSEEGLALKINGFKGDGLEIFNAKVEKNITITGAQADVIHANLMTSRNLFTYDNKVSEVHRIHSLKDDEECEVTHSGTFVRQIRKEMSIEDIERELGYKISLTN